MVKKYSFVIFMKIIAHLIGVASLALVARRLGSVVLGTVAFAVSYIALFSSFADLGYGSAHIKRISEGKNFGKCNGTYFTVKIFLNILMIIIVIGSVIVQKYIFGSKELTGTKEVVIYIVLAGTAFSNMAMMLTVTFSAKKEVAKKTTPEIIQLIFDKILKIIIALAGLSVFYLAGVKVVTAVIWLILLLMFFRGYPIHKFDLKYFKSYTKFAIPVILIGFLTNYSEHLDIVMIGYLVDADAVGQYTVGKRLAKIFLIFVIASNGLLFPTYSKLHKDGNLKRIRLLANKVEKYFSMFMIPVAMLVTINSRQICFYVVGNEFLDIAPEIFSILIWFIAIKATMYPYSQQLAATNHVKLAAKISVFYLGLNVLLNFIFIPQKILNVNMLGWGAIGAAIATLVSAIIGTITYRIFAFKITKSKPNKNIILHILSTIIMAAIILIFKNNISNLNILKIITINLIGIIIYILFMVITKELGYVEIKYLLTFLNFKEISKYAVNEIKGK